METESAASEARLVAQRDAAVRYSENWAALDKQVA